MKKSRNFASESGQQCPLFLLLMEKIINQEFGGERPLYCKHDLELEGVTIHVGESSLKETSNIVARNCRFEGKYVFWETRGFNVSDCVFAESARSSLWYSENGTLTHCQIDAPKMFRRMKGIYLNDCQFSCAQEMLWDCSTIRIKDCTTLQADYLGTHAKDVEIENWHQEGNYAFQYGEDIVIRNSLLNSKDALWECNNVTVYDSEINGEYLGWYSKNLRLVRCHITGEQPLCYCENLVMEDCTMGEDANLAFEYSSIQATIRGHVTSIKNPTTGRIQADSIGEIILDANIKQPGDCVING